MSSYTVYMCEGLLFKATDNNVFKVISFFNIIFIFFFLKKTIPDFDTLYGVVLKENMLLDV